MKHKKFVAIGAAALVAGSVGLALPAFAHNGGLVTTCAGATVDLTSYPEDSHVTFTVDGNVVSDEDFDGAFHVVYGFPTSSLTQEITENTVSLKVTSGDGNPKFNIDINRTVAACPPASPTPSPTMSTTPTPSPSTTTTATPAPTTSSTPAPTSGIGTPISTPAPTATSTPTPAPSSKTSSPPVQQPSVQPTPSGTTEDSAPVTSDHHLPVVSG